MMRNKDIEDWLIKRGMFSIDCRKCVNRKQGCYLNCKFYQTKKRKEKTMEKQIEEMAKILVKNSYLCKGEYIRTTGKHNRDHCEDCDLRNACLNYDSATDLYNAGYRKVSSVAEEIFAEIEKTLNRKIARSKPQFEKLHSDEKDLSVWGYKDMGYFQGIVSTCEDMQDIIADLKKKYTEGEG